MATPSLTDVGIRRQQRIPKFEGLRGILAVGVVVYHVAFQAGVSSFIDQPGNGFWGVMADGLGVCLPPFFVLSGMMLYLPYARHALLGTPKPRKRRFFARRALRLLPAYWAVVLVALFAFNRFELDSVLDVLRPLLLLHFFWYEGQPLYGIEPTWTVPVEFVFYLALPVLAWLAHRLAARVSGHGRKAARLLIPLVVLEVVGLAWIVYTNLPSTGPTMLWYWPPYYIGYFAGGMALAVLIALSEVSPRLPAAHRFVLARPLACWGIAVAVFVLYALKPIGTPGMGDYPALAQEVVNHFLVFLFAILLILPMTVTDVRSRLMDAVLTNRPIVYLGKISFGIYLWHEIVINIWLRNGSVFGESPVPTPVFRGEMGFWELLGFTLALSVLIATVSYYVIERPAMRLSSPRRPTVVPTSAPLASDTTAERRPESVGATAAPTDRG